MPSGNHNNFNFFAELEESSFFQDFGSLDPKNRSQQRTPCGDTQSSFWENDDYFKLPGVKMEPDLMTTPKLGKRQFSSSSSSQDDFGFGTTLLPPASNKRFKSPLILGRDDSFNLKTADFDFTNDFNELPDLKMLNFGATGRQVLEQQVKLENRPSPSSDTEEKTAFCDFDTPVPVSEMRSSQNGENFFSFDDNFGGDLATDVPTEKLNDMPTLLPLSPSASFSMTRSMSTNSTSSIPEQTLTRTQGPFLLMAPPTMPLLSQPRQPLAQLHLNRYTTQPVEKAKQKPRRGRAPRCASEVVIDEIIEINVSLRALTDLPSNLHSHEFEDVVTCGTYSRKERRSKIDRFKQKRLKAQSLDRSVLYKCRKRFADARPRVGGRFVKIND